MWLIGFFPLVASILMGLCGVIRPLQRLPRPTLPSSPISADVPVTVRKILPLSMISPVLTKTLTFLFVCADANLATSSLMNATASLYSPMSAQNLSIIGTQSVSVMSSCCLYPIILTSVPIIGCLGLTVPSRCSLTLRMIFSRSLNGA